MTKTVKKNTPVQVNTDKIGVLVHTNQPPVVETYEIVTDLTVPVITTGALPDLPDVGSSHTPVGAYIATLNDGPTFFIDGVEDDGIESDTNRYITKVYDDTVYYAVEYYENRGNYLWCPKQPPYDVSSPNVPFNLYEYDEVNDTMTQVTYINSNLSSELYGGYYTDGSVYINQTKSTEAGKVVNLVTIDLYDCVFASSGLFAYVTDSSTGVYQDCDFTKEESTIPNFYAWRHSSSDTTPLFPYGDIVLYTPDENPLIGTYANINVYEYDTRQLITDVVTREIPQPDEDVNCVVKYSVNGEDWTEYPDALTDKNNVINNIPRYMYLEFSQDVEITQE